MITANLYGKRIFANDVEDRSLNFLCPFCNDKMILVKGDIKIDHFRHYSKKDCESEPETAEHLNGKKYLYNFFSKKYETELEPKMTGFKPDIFVKMNGFNIAVEYQCSPLSMEEFLFRTKRYRENKIYVLWIFGTNNFLKEVNNGIYRIRDIEKKAHELYFGRVYYLNNLNNSFLRRIVQVKFGVHTEIKESDWNGYHSWTKYYKKLREIEIINYIIDSDLEFKWNTWKGNDYFICLFIKYFPLQMLINRKD